ncbi:hypothetical protein KPL78_29550 [Roseomonas sp. HJA6]|uniref:Phage tail protein n=1 Tax=Roseomonas alba TaxID=2846776 RepID=A0ABS7AI75_9PROT|nr:hypothetical protein [Neoroseomonas alba]MBW6402028.1 hypothetical protein [Neoroseomonas alba]
MAAWDILRLRQGKTTRRVVLTLADRQFDLWTAVHIERDIGNLAAGATLEFYDQARARAAFPASPYQPETWRRIACGQRGKITIDGEEVLRGWVARFQFRLTGKDMACSISFLDDAAHLVHCAAAPLGPVEYRNLTVLQFAQRICEPYGLTVRADVDVGAPFPVIGIDVSDTALAAIEKLARQRELIVTSDGVGSVVLTRGGNTPAAAPLRLGEALVELDHSDDWQGRFSDYYVKGQTRASGRPARLDGTANPLTGSPATPGAAAASRTVDRAAVVMTGHARDEEITLHRPTVRAAKSQSGTDTVQAQADWLARVARGKGQEHQALVLDWRAGDQRELWRPNSLVLIDDPFGGILEERLIGALTYSYSDQGATTRLRVVRKGAYDLDPAVRERRHQRRRQQGRAQDGTARGLTAG